MIPSLRALGQVLRRTPIKPASVATLLGRHEGYLAFRRIVQEVFPEAAAEILAATGEGGTRENARVWALQQRVETDYFPIYEIEEYDQVAFGIPFARNAWDYDRFHDLELRTGETLLFALCAQPYDEGYDTRVALLDSSESSVPRSLLAEIPERGFTPGELHERLDGTPYAAAAHYADWLWGETDTVFLDIEDDVTVDVDWTRDNLLELKEQWRRAEEILHGIDALAVWLEEDPTAHFARLLAAAGGQDATFNYERTRRLYACEITEAGLVPISHDQSEPLALPVGAAA